jgi:hypothetical protein
MHSLEKRDAMMLHLLDRSGFIPSGIVDAEGFRRERRRPKRVPSGAGYANGAIT